MSTEDMQTVFRSKGVSNDVPVVVYGGWSAPTSWGEEGRIYWQLDYLNHTQAYVLYGGIYAWLDVDEVRAAVGVAECSRACILSAKLSTNQPINQSISQPINQ